MSAVRLGQRELNNTSLPPKQPYRDRFEEVVSVWLFPTSGAVCLWCESPTTLGRPNHRLELKRLLWSEQLDGALLVLKEHVNMAKKKAQTNSLQPLRFQAV